MFGFILPFLGTTAGAALVFFLRKGLSDFLSKALSGFAAGVMVAASFFSLLLPSIESSHGSVWPALIGFWVGILFLLILDHLIPHLHMGSQKAEGLPSRLKRNTMLVLAVTLHNIPEGMAVGVIIAGFDHAQFSWLAALAFSLGIAIQNVPEGTIISVPLAAQGQSRFKSFMYGVMSGIVEPIGGILTYFAVGQILVWLPYLLSFAAGAMLYVVVEELIPEASEEPHSNVGVISFAVGFSLMMCLDLLLG